MVIDALPLDAESVAGYLNHEDDHHGDRGGPDRGNLPHSPGQPANGRLFVYFSGYSNSTVAPHSTVTVFNALLWDAPHQVRIRASEDANATNETVTLTHRVESDDPNYNGITVTDLTVNVIDNDPPQVTGVWTQPGDSNLVVNWTAADNATGYRVQWRVAGQSYNTYGRIETITSGSTTSYTIPNLGNGTEYMVRVTATRTGVSDGPPSAEVTGTPTATP